MSQQFKELNTKLIEFIEAQKIFFVATATEDSRINLSPKGMDSLRVISNERVIWLNVTGSGNETAAHIQQNPRMTIMFNAFEGPPMILRLFGFARVIHHNEEDWNTLHSQLPPLPGARQIFDLSIEMVQTSCGMAVPFYDYQGERNELNQWASKKGKKGLAQYWRDKNQHSIDDIETKIVEKNL